jgi:hypothetical protein
MTPTTSPDGQYLSTADRCRLALKTAGFKSKQVTVRSDGGSIYVTIRTADVSITAVTAIVNEFVVVYRDHGPSQEILTGGTSVYTKYAPEALAPLKAEITAILMATPARIAVAIGPHHAYWSPDYGTTATPDRNSTIHTTTAMVVGSQMTLRASGLDFGAEQLATDLLARGIKTLAPEVTA